MILVPSVAGVLSVIADVALLQQLNGSSMQADRMEQIVARCSMVDTVLSYVATLNRFKNDPQCRRSVQESLIQANSLSTQLQEVALTDKQHLSGSTERLRRLCHQLELELAVKDESNLQTLVQKARAEVAILSESAVPGLSVSRTRRSDCQDQFLMALVLEAVVQAVCGILLILVARNQLLTPINRLGNVILALAGKPSSASTDPAQLENELDLLAGSLAETRAKERAVVQNAVDVICLIDARGRFVSVNAASTNVLGFASEKLIGRSFTEFLVPDDIDASLAAMIGADMSIDKIVFETRWIDPTRSIIHLLWSAHWSAKDHGLFCVVHDITERKLAEQLLRQSEERIRVILASLPVAILTLNQEGHIEFLNRSAEVLSGYSSQELIGKNLCQIIPEKLRDGNKDSLEQLIKECHNTLIENTITPKSGEAIASELTISALNLRDQTGYLVVALDVSERHEIERVKREFVAMVSHDLRTPLSSINVILSVLERGAADRLNETEYELLRQGQKEIQRLIRLVNDLLDIEKMASGKFSLHMERISMREVIISATDAVRPLGELRKIQIDVPENDLQCAADGARLIQVVANLLSNAIKFAPPKSTVKIQLDDVDGNVKVSVVDRGRGVPADKVALIFERFKQLHGEDATKKGGHGLGLTICKTIVEQHGGTIGVDSTVDEGSIFWFVIPGE